MSLPSDTPTPRRDFIGTLAVSALALAGAGCATSATAAQTTPSPSGRAAAAPASTTVTHWDDSWFARLTAKHKGLFDSPEIVENATPGPSQAVRYINGMHDALGAENSDVQTVVVVRHKSIPFAFNDAMWAKYKIGEVSKVKGDGDAWATKNPHASPHQPSGGASGGDRPQSNFGWLTSHGHILLGCDLATQGYATQLAERTKGTMHTIYEELKANLVPGLILQPNGIYAVHRAQEAGCTYIRSS
jgi:hypothetical protein